MYFVLGGDSFASSNNSPKITDKYLEILNKFKSKIYFDHSKEYKNSYELISILLKNNILDSRNIFIKSPVSLRFNNNPEEIYNFLIREIDLLKVNSFGTFFWTNCLSILLIISYPPATIKKY